MKTPVDFEKDNKNIKNLFPYSINSLLPLKKKAAFTLTEVLLAVLIVGIIAAMVLPAIVTKYQDKAFESAFNREVHSLQDSIDSLAAVENQSSFYETTLATNTGTYMKKYLRVSKYCGTSGKDCFGKFYSEYSNHEKKTYTPSYDGNCAILKNGTSVCLSVNGGNIAMLIDVNGPKGPNVLGRDLRTYTHSIKGKTGYNMSSSGIISVNQAPIEDSSSSEDPCEGMTCGCGDLPACDPCSMSGVIYVPDIGCVYQISSYNPIKAGDPKMDKWDPDWNSNTCKILSYPDTPPCKDYDNYWAGAKKACADLGMRLASATDLESVRRAACREPSLGLPTSGSFWNLDFAQDWEASGMDFRCGRTEDWVGSKSGGNGTKVLCLGDSKSE